MSNDSGLVPVTVDNFVRAETDVYLARLIGRTGLGAMSHAREPIRVDRQTVIRINRDTLYSSAVFDLDAGPATVSLPDAAGRFMSMQVIDQDHYTPTVVYGPGEHRIDDELVGTRYVCVLIRTLVDPDDPDDVAVAHRLQDEIGAAQDGQGVFKVPTWDRDSLTTVRDTLKRVAPGMRSGGTSFGTKDEVDPISHLVGTAVGWGGNPDRDATYVGGYPDLNDGVTVHQVTVSDVPVDGFWSISVYNSEGFFEPNELDRYSVNSITADPNSDGSVTVQFGGSANDAANVIPITDGWNYVVRLYRPRPEILDGTWKFPRPTPMPVSDL